jgi:hypothetical protein
LVAVTVYFALAGALGQFVEAALVFPLTGVERPPQSLHGHFDTIADVVSTDYRHTQVLFWGGLLALLGLLVMRRIRGGAGLRRAIADPYVHIVIASFVGVVAFSISDFQGYPDLYPALPYAALGVGGTAAALGAWLAGRPLGRAVPVAALASAAILAGLSWHSYSVPEARETRLVHQRAEAAAIERMLDPGDTIYAMGDPTILVLTKRRNPSRFIYLGSGVASWYMRHTPGRFAGWKARIAALDPAVIVINIWTGKREMRMERWLRKSYDVGYVGRTRVFVKPAVRARAARRGVTVTSTPRHLSASKTSTTRLSSSGAIRPSTRSSKCADARCAANASREA